MTVEDSAPNTRSTANHLAIDHRPGQRFGRLVVVERAENHPRGHRRWLCQCDCGATALVTGSDLRDGRVRSCGCLERESRSVTHRLHGHSGTHIYTVWRNMIRRCQNPKDKRWRDYGGRGIKVCSEWRGFEAFFADMGYPPDGTTLDRIDVNGDYCPANCRWATVAEQARNRRNNHVVEIAGERLCLVDWLARLNIKAVTFKQRVKRGMSDVEALTTPLLRGGRKEAAGAS